MVAKGAVGLIALAALAIGSKALHGWLPIAPLPLMTLGVSMLLGALIGRSRRLRRWHPPMEVPLSVGMILLGVQFDASLVETLGPIDLLRLGLHWCVVGVLFLAVARLGWMERRTAGLLGIGLGGSGISAIVAAARGDRHVDVRTQRAVISITLAAGALGFAFAPWIARTLALDAPQLAAWCGLFMPTTAEAVLIGSGHSPHAMQLVGAYRFAVNVLQWLPVVVYLKRFGDPVGTAGSGVARRVFASTVRRIPAFVWGLSLFGLFGFFGAFPPEERRIVGNLTNWAFLMALAGIGLVTRPQSYVDVGVRSALLALLSWAAAAGLLLLVIRAT